MKSVTKVVIETTGRKRGGPDWREVRGDNERREIAAAQKVLASQATGSNRVAETVTR